MERAERIAKSVRNLTENYTEDDNGVWAFDGKLEVRPAYQREFVYNEKQSAAVIDTILSELPLGVLHFNQVNENHYQVIDGQQRIISICRYVNNEFCWNGKHYNQLTNAQQRKIMGYELDIYRYHFDDRKQVVDWFKVINIAGKALNDQEILNAGYTGSWLTDAKKYFSKGDNPQAAIVSKGFVKATAATQGYLEIAIKYIANKNNQTIEEYMQEHFEDETADTMWNYFRTIIRWAKKIHAATSGLTDCVDWGILYEDYHTEYNDDELEELGEQIDELMADVEVSRHSDLIEYVLSGRTDIRLLHLRTFDKKMMDKKWAEQNGICPVCGKKYDRKDMVGDHIVPWSRGGKTTWENLQMLCKVCNSKKSDCYPVEEEEE